MKKKKIYKMKNNNNKNEFNLRTISINFTKAKFSDAPLCRLHGINTEIVKHITSFNVVCLVVERI